MKMFAKLLFVAVFFAVLASLAGSASAYSNIGMSLSKEKISRCPASTETLDLTLTNNDDVTHTYSLSLEMPQGWGIPDNGFIQPDMLLASGQSEKISFWINPPAVAPGIYNVKVKAKAGVEEAYKNIEVEVLRCHDVAIELPPTITMCADSEFQYTFSITNKGKENEEFETVASSSWGAELYKGSVTIEAGKKKDIAFKLVVPKESGKITVKAASKSSYAKDEQYTRLSVQKCYDLQARIEPKEISSCLGTSSKFVLSIRNTGTASDTYIIQTLAWVVPSQGNVTIPPGEEKSIDLFANPDKKGKGPFDVFVISKGYAKLKTNVTASVDVKECKSVAVIVSPAKQEVCRGAEAGFSVTVKNTGTVKDSYELEANVGVLESNKVSLDVGEVKGLTLKIDTKQMEFGEKQVTVIAKSGDITDQNSVQLVTKNCYSAEFGVSPQTSSVCMGDKITYILSMKNIGEFADNYTLGLEGQNIGSVNLAPKEMKIFSTALNVSYPEGAYKFKFRLNSKYISMEAVSDVTIKPKGACYKVEISSEEPASRIDPGKGVAIAVKIKNKGDRPDNYVLEVQGPSWAHLSQNNVSLKPGEDTNVYLYASPGYEVAKNTYNAVIKAKSENAEEDLTFRIGVGVMPGSAEGGKNASETKIPTGAIIGLKGNTGKVILLALIVLLILIIMVVKFVLFVK